MFGTNFTILSLCMVLVLLAGRLMADHGYAYFAAPNSGARVTDYKVSLPMRRGEKVEFNIPMDCGKIQEFFDAGASRWGRRYEQLMWVKVHGDCHYYQFLHRSKLPVQKDYVSTYDFANADLDVLLANEGCAPGQINLEKRGCVPVSEVGPDITKFIVFSSHPETGVYESCECQLENGVFKGRYIQNEHGRQCIVDNLSPGLRLMSVDFTDVNVDGVMDAVLRFMPLGYGSKRLPMVFVLTRYAADGPFSLLSLAGG